MISQEELRALLSEGGFVSVASAEIRKVNQGRIHHSWTVKTGAGQAPLLLQQLNRVVIEDTARLVAVTRLMLSSQGVGDCLVDWPATDSPIFEHTSGSWLCRYLLDAKTPHQPCNREQLRAMTSALYHVHQCVPVDKFRAVRYHSVNPWNPASVQNLEKLVTCKEARVKLEPRDVELLDSYQHGINRISDWEKIHTTHPETVRPETVVHRDPKPSNFLQLASGNMVLIDFDTTGVGYPVQDLGEMVRALATRDEQPELPLMGVKECNELLECIGNAYPVKEITTGSIRLAAGQSCLWQAARFIDDHLAGDRYYPVLYHGENRERAELQLSAFNHLFAP